MLPPTDPVMSNAKVPPTSKCSNAKMGNNEDSTGPPPVRCDLNWTLLRLLSRIRKTRVTSDDSRIPLKLTSIPTLTMNVRELLSATVMGAGNVIAGHDDEAKFPATGDAPLPSIVNRTSDHNARCA